jgi:hydrogenase nickel incorporation protein HypA/HybF
MHEMSIVESMMEIIEDQARLYNSQKVVTVSLEFGALSGVMPSAVEFAFEVLSKGTVAEGAVLAISIIPLKIKCLDCAGESVLEDYQPTCPLCNSDLITFLQGRNELRVASLELEDPIAGQAE